MLRIYFNPSCRFCQALKKLLLIHSVDIFNDSRIDCRDWLHPDYKSDKQLYDYKMLPMVINLRSNQLIGGYNEVSNGLTRSSFDLWYEGLK